MRRFAKVVAALGTVGVAALGTVGVAAAAPAAAANRHAAACATNWGTNAKHRGPTSGTVATRVLAVRAGRHGCFDRLVIDLSGGRRPPFSAQYVRHIVAQGSGRVLHMRGHAFILINVRGPGGAHYPSNAVNLTSVSGFTTFRQVRGAGSFERITAIGLGVRARLPFRVLELGSSTAGWRIVIDVGH